MTIESINHSKFLNDVKNMGRKYSATLGFMPDGGFDDYAKKNCILIAVDNDTLIGYLMYRIVSKSLKITIVHLCVDEKYRGKNVSFQLLDALKRKYIKHFDGIYLNCREDFTFAVNLWSKYGFISLKRVRSRSFEEHYLQTWYYDLNLPNIFKTVSAGEPKIKALLDTNIIVKLRDADINIAMSPTENPRCLTADWLIGETIYYYALEIYNEILRDSDKNRADYSRKYLDKTFVKADANMDTVNIIADRLSKIIKRNTDNDISDRKQIATCIAAQIPYFITYDAYILSKRVEIEDSYEIQIFNPQEFVIQIDKLFNEKDYLPTQLNGVVFHTISKVNPNDISFCVETFLNKQEREEKIRFNEIVFSVINNQLGELYVIKNKDAIIAFYGSRFNENECVVEFLRIINNSIKNSLFTQIISNIINDCLHKHISKVILSEKYINADTEKILLNFGFLKTIAPLQYIKYIINQVCAIDELPNVLNDCNLDANDFVNNDNLLFRLEKIFFPLKIKNLNIPTYIIPIKAYWAAQLFDYLSANNTIYGAIPEKLWSFENAYYRHSKPAPETSPARILWYVSDDNNYQRVKAIVATSILNDVKTGKPKDIFREYKHYGIYEWLDISKLCNNDINTDIRVLHFSHSEVFKNIVSYAKISEIFVKYGQKKNTFVSPVRISDNIYFEIYKIGKWGEKK